ncbi:hypothetical protein [Clostridium beijerinckii]|uniref:hypothetical protein n=1 Tax=Clostridium beijerinckii TaxID=1520 RepID=UPI00047B6E85|nr:hypothetical protein [Clostridium beijerinckii]
MKLKKITTIMAIALTIAATSTTFGQAVYAAENSNISASTSVSKSNKIDSNTVITEDNIYDVLAYLGVDSNKLIKNDVPKGNSNTTVGEVQKVIEKSKKMPHTITLKPVTHKSNNTKTTSNNVKLALDDDDDTPVDSVYVHRNHNLGDGYSVTYSCSGQYRHGQWCGATDGDASITSIAPLMSYSITDKDLSLSYDSDTITMVHSVTIQGSYGVGKFSIPVISGLVVTGTDNFKIEDFV